MIDELRREAASRLRRFEDVSSTHPVWSGDKYKKFLSTPEAVERAILYVRENPAKAGQQPQDFDFVRPYRGEWKTR